MDTQECVIIGGMTVKLNIQEIAGRRGLNMSQLQREARMPMATMQRYWHATGQGGAPLTSVDLRHLDRLCKALKCTVGDILVYTPDESEGGNA
jgi:DNA-binding Xre family transcriptional regulator